MVQILPTADFSKANFGSGASFVGAGPWFNYGPENDVTLYHDTGLATSVFGQMNEGDLKDALNQYTINNFATQVPKTTKLGEYWSLIKETITTDFDYEKLHELQSGLTVDSNVNSKWDELMIMGDDWTNKAWSDAAGQIATTRRDTLHRFSFLDEALSQPNSEMHHTHGKKEIIKKDTGSKRINAHKDFLPYVLPKFPKGFNIMAALGWERDASGIVIPHFRRGQYIVGAQTQQSVQQAVFGNQGAKLIKNLLINKDIYDVKYPPKPESAEYDDYSARDVFGGKQVSNEVSRPHYYDPMARYSSQDLSGTDILTINTLEHGNRI